jgi:hypothetical protein
MTTGIFGLSRSFYSTIIIDRTHSGARDSPSPMLASTLREKFLHERRKLQKDFWALISQAIDD